MANYRETHVFNSGPGAWVVDRCWDYRSHSSKAAQAW